MVTVQTLTFCKLGPLIPRKPGWFILFIILLSYQSIVILISDSEIIQKVLLFKNTVRFEDVKEYCVVNNKLLNNDVFCPKILFWEREIHTEGLRQYEKKYALPKPGAGSGS